MAGIAEGVQKAEDLGTAAVAYLEVRKETAVEGTGADSAAAGKADPVGHMVAGRHCSWLEEPRTALAVGRSQVNQPVAATTPMSYCYDTLPG